MAIELCRDHSSRGLGLGSPRISFSHDLNQSDIIPIEPLTSYLLDYSYDFDFCVSKRSYDQESSLADEIFADGIILPIQVKPKKMPTKSKSACSSPLMQFPSEESKDREEKQGSSNKSFWKFKRSKSLNCGSLYKRGLLWPLPLLSRSKSTGSTASDNGSMNSKDGNFNGGSKQCYRKNTSSTNHHQKPPLKKNYGVVRVSPVLNIPSEKLLGFGSIFSAGKDTGKKK